ncbi:MAG: beta-1,6-N-acetylglucosaminyltransferase [Lachnospiraceae bacterium]|nr:beta-1,6-N-acetylglucosaminyltransferase [Lachnospiraceae bacterium]
MGKHAYLIMAHNEFEVLGRLLRMLDYCDNDIYLHIDKKTKCESLERFQEMVKCSKLYIVPRRRVYWGDMSQIRCEYDLLETAVTGKYEYYHLLSGVDMPLKSQRIIHDFLDNCTDEFISNHTEGMYGDEFLYKVQYYFPFQKFIGNGKVDGNGVREYYLRKLSEWQYRLLMLQKEKGVDRTQRDNVTYYKGNNWFSITHDFAEYVLKRKKDIFRRYRYTNAADEIFLPTLAMNSQFQDRVVKDCLRKIDWQRGTPYEFTWKEKEELENAPEFFVRKLSYTREPRLVEWLYERLQEK